ncbi:MAG: hypothetical protein K5660_01245 [Paludibacteraceae bacterium]|nr:hypothetical protein [Paludibacteraceae bacterium]
MKDIYKSFMSYLMAHKDDPLSRDVVFNVPYQLLRCENRVSILREKGAFFSGDKLVDFLFTDVPIVKTAIYDPAAGCGDLLLRYLDKLELASSFSESMQEWECIVYAAEKEPSFVKLMKLRLWLLLYLKYHERTKLGQLVIPDLRERFAGVVCRDAFKYLPETMPNIVIMNPPFQQVDSNGVYSWGTGKVSYAAIFLYEMYKRFPKSRILAILPDVLRSGSRYEKLRTTVASDLKSVVRVYGRFDKKTDIDVFVLDHRPDMRKRVLRNAGRKQGRMICDDFAVHVGAVVPHRDALKGRSCFFLTADNVPPGSNIVRVKEKIKSVHKSVKGPFVVLRRTSSPSDKIRCVSSIVSSSHDFHLDNHLIYLKPREHKSELKLCQEVCNFFSSQECSAIVSRLIRCRHLTVRIIRNLTYKGGK